jgi:hypothetical protein
VTGGGHKRKITERQHTPCSKMFLIKSQSDTRPLEIR